MLRVGVYLQVGLTLAGQVLQVGLTLAGQVLQVGFTLAGQVAPGALLHDDSSHAHCTL